MDKVFISELDRLSHVWDLLIYTRSVHDEELLQDAIDELASIINDVIQEKYKLLSPNVNHSY